MAITSEVREQLERTKARWDQRQQIGNSMSKELEELPKGPLSTDNRLTTVFEVGIKTPEEIQDYISSYYRADTASRAPYLPRMFDELLSYRHEASITDVAKTEQNLARLREYASKFCYSENLTKDNPEYFHSHYTPAQARLIAAGRDLFADSTGILNNTLNANGYTFKLEPHNPELGMTDSKVNSFLTAQTADFLYRQTRDSLEGKRINTTMSLKIPEGADKKIFFMDKDLDKGTLTMGSPACQSAATLFECMFSIPLNPTSVQGRDREKMGKDIFDMIYIDGVTAREAFGKKYESASPKAQIDMMKVEVINAMTSGKSRIDLATLQRDKNNQISVVVNRVEPDLREIQPTIKEDYSAVRRMFNWGPFKCKTRAEKQQTLSSSDPGRDKRHEQIAGSFREAIGDLMVQEDRESRFRSLGKTGEERKKAHDLLQGDKARSRRIPAGKSVTRDQRGNPLHPIDNAYFSKAGIPPQPDNTLYLNGFFLARGRDKGYSDLEYPEIRHGVADLIMLSQGYSMTQLLEQTPKMEEAREKAGKLLVDTLTNPDDELGKKTLGKLCCEGARKLIGSEIPIPDPSNPVAVAENHELISRLQGISSSWNEMMDHSFGRHMLSEDYERDEKATSHMIASMKVLSAYSTAAQGLVDYLESPEAVNPDAITETMGSPKTAPSPLIEGIIGKYVMDTFSKMVPGDTFCAASFSHSQLTPLNQELFAAKREADTALSRRDSVQDLGSYLNGDAPCSLPGIERVKPMEPRAAVSFKELMAESKKPAESHSRPSREATSPEHAKRESKEHESADKGISK